MRFFLLAGIAEKLKIISWQPGCREANPGYTAKMDSVDNIAQIHLR